MIDLLERISPLRYEIIDDVFAIHVPSSCDLDHNDYATILVNNGVYSSGVIAFDELGPEAHFCLLMSGTEITTSLRNSMTWRFVLNSFLIKDFWDYD